MWLKRSFRALPIRHKLLAMVLLPLAGMLPLLALLLLWWGNAAFDRLLIAKVQADLAVANGQFERLLAEVAAATAAQADSHTLRVALDNGDEAALVQLLQAAKRRGSLDYIKLRDADGRLLLSDSGMPEAAALAPAAAAAAAPSSGIRVLQGAQLDELGPALRARIDVPLLPMLNTTPSTRSVEDRALVVQATYAVRAADGRVLAQLEGGVLLNRNLPLIDHINELVYPDGSLPFGSRGTATLFLDDVRISTNVRLFNAAAAQQPGRAIGTRVSHAVRDAVLGGGQTWLARAFVVDDWYVSAYAPLSDVGCRRVGMLYVGFLEEPFRRFKYAALAGLGAIFAAAMLAAAFVSLRWARAIFRPIEQMDSTMRRLEAGELGARVGRVGSDDELGHLARHFDRLLGAIDAQTATLQRWNAELDAKVAERTSSLQARTRQLADAQAQLLRNEKLAAMGQLSAGIAHEVNNPIAVLQGNLDLMRELLPASAAALVRNELQLADEQVERVRLIVAQLLQLARPGEHAARGEAVDTQRVIDACLMFTAQRLSRAGVRVRCEFGASRRPVIDRNALQQVLINLLSNAAEAMPDGGELLIRSRDHGADGVEISLTDSGSGLDAELMDQLFKPFVTRRKDGTGLGLWISRAIVERYDGELHAANRSDGHRGAVFTLRLRCEA